MSVTNNDFLKSKIGGFCDFLEMALSKRVSHARFAEARGKLGELRACDVGHFILYVTSEICPRKTNIKSYLTKLIEDNGADIKDISAEELNKLERYCHCFIECVEQ